MSSLQHDLHKIETSGEPDWVIHAGLYERIIWELYPHPLTSMCVLEIGANVYEAVGEA